MTIVPSGAMRWYLVAVAIFLGVAVLAFAMQRRATDHLIEEMLAARLEAESQVVAIVLDQGGKVPEIPRAVGIRLTLIDTDGTVLADSEADPRTMDNQSSRRDVTEARMNGIAKIRGPDLDLEPGRKTTLAATRKLSDGRLLRVSSSLHTDSAAVSAVLFPVLFAGGAFILVGILILGITWKRVQARVLALIDVSRAYAAGQLQQRSGLAGEDVYAVIGRELDALGERLQVTQDRLAGQRQLLETTLDGLAEGVACIDRLDRVLYANPAYRQFAAGGIDSIGIIGEPFYRHLGNEGVGSALTDLREGKTPRRITAFEHRRRNFEAVVADGGQGLAVLVLHDRTELRQLEIGRRDFLSAVSHELKTPLTAIVGYADTLLEGAVDDPTVARSFVEGIGRHADRLAGLVRDVLTLTRLEQGAWEQRPEPVDFVRLAWVVLEDHRPAAVAKPVVLTLDGPDPIHGVCDPELFRQMAGNLVSNAIRYNRPGGQVRLELTQVEGQLRLKVIDTGIGISAEHRARVFERFYRVDSHRSRQTGGTGLGLAIVRHLVNVLHGEIDFVSGESGTTFTVLLPLRPEEA